MGMIIGGVIGVLIGVLAPYILKVIASNALPMASCISNPI
jgi:galactitol-specific phosphotransferase system IIC component